jgi:hypothetical protein
MTGDEVVEANLHHNSIILQVRSERVDFLPKKQGSEVELWGTHLEKF